MKRQSASQTLRLILPQLESSLASPKTLTSIGIVKGIPVEVYASRVMPDPRNPRTSPEKKHAFAIPPGSGDLSHRYPPIPDPRSSETPGAPELLVGIQSRDHLAHAHSTAAT